MTDQRTLRSETSGNSSQTSIDVWRKEVHARVSGYRTRRGRRIEGAYSMRFPFPPLEPEVSGPTTSAPPDSANEEEFADANIASAGQTSATAVASSKVCDLEPQLTTLGPPTEPGVSFTPDPALPPSLPDPAGPTSAPLPRPRPQRKVIAFPRQAPGAPEMLHSLADPVLPEQPRILDVPEELEAFPTTPFLDGLQLGPNTQAVGTTHADHIELPFRAVGIARRLYSGLLDGAIVASSFAVFAAVGYKTLSKLTFTKPVLLTATGLPVLLWAIYHYLLLVYGGATAGMCVAKIRLRTFKGRSPRQRERRHRVMALYFSMASFLMGLLWAFVDADALCWHDRISRTYLTDRE